MNVLPVSVRTDEGMTTRCDDPVLEDEEHIGDVLCPSFQS